MLTGNWEGILICSWRVSSCNCTSALKMAASSFCHSLYDTSYSWHNTSAVILTLIWVPWIQERWYISLWQYIVSQYIKYCASIRNFNLIMSHIWCRSSAILMQPLLPNSPLQELLASLHTRWTCSIDVLLFLLRCHVVCSTCWFSPICPPIKSKVWLRCGRHSHWT